MIGYAEYAQKVEESERYSKEAHILKKENARLKELNREMVEALEEVSKEYLEDKVYHSISYDTFMQVSIAITKAKEEEGE